MFALKFAGAISALLALINLSIFLLGTDFYHLVVIPSVEMVKTYQLIYDEQAKRILLFSSSIKSLFAVYLFSAASFIPRLPLLRTIIVLSILYLILTAVSDFLLPFLSLVEMTYQSWVMWVITTILNITLILSSIYGLKNSWSTLSMDSNWREAVAIISGLLIGFLIFIIQGGAESIEWVKIFVDSKASALLPENSFLMVGILWMYLPKIVVLSMLSALLISRLGRQRHFIYAVLVSFIFFTYILGELPFISILFEGTHGTRMASMLDASRHFNLVLYLLIYSISLNCLNRWRRQNQWGQSC